MRIDEFEGVTKAQLNALENVLDKVFAKLGIDVEFTRHFLDRVNDERNIKQITIKELGELFAKEFRKWGKPIAQMGPDAEAVMKDLSSDINLPFALNWNKQSGMLELVAKTVMRKKNFRTPNKEFPVEAAYPAQQISRYNPDGETYRGTTNRIPNSKSVSKSDITVKRKKADFPDGATDDTTFGDFAKKELKQTALDVISTLNKREQLILKARFGFEPFNKSYTLQQIADVMNLSRDRVRQIEAKALRKLKHPRSSRKLRSYMDENITEDLGSIPPLVDLIVMAVVGQTTVAALKAAYKTGKYALKLKRLADKAGVKLNNAVMGEQGVAESNPFTDARMNAIKAGKKEFTVNGKKYRVTGDTSDEEEAIANEAINRDEYTAKLAMQQKDKFFKAALAALDRLVKSDPRGQSVGGYAFDIARAFDGINGRELARVYDETK